MVKIPGFIHVSNYQKNKKGGGVTILIQEGISYRRRTGLDVFDEGLTESIFIEVRSKNGKQITFGSLYKPPNVDIDQFSEHLSYITYKVRQVQGKHLPEMVLGMDHNMNLLNSVMHPPTHKFIETLGELMLYPTITHPTRITYHSATLIDNIFVTETLHRNFESTILIDDISDHLPTIAMLKQTRLMNKELIEFKSRCLNETKLKQVNHKLMRVDWIGVLTCTMSDEKFNQFSNWIEQVLDKITPIKHVRISAKRRFVKPWMTRGLEVASHKKLNLYKKTLSNNCTEADQARYKEHRNLYNSLKSQLKRNYYPTRCVEYKQNAKKLWSLIKDTVRRVKHKGSIIPYITVDGLKQHNPQKITNSFGKFYSTLGSDLANKILPGNTPISTYLSNIPRNLNSMVLCSTTIHEIDNLIRQLPNKTSHGFDNISNMMLKSLRTSITFPLCHIFNCSLMEGSFPERMKKAEVIPLYKGKDIDNMINYRPISLLITLSKLLEKIMHTRLYGYLEHNHLLYPSQYGFQTRRLCEEAITELVGYILQSKNHNEHCASIFLNLSKAFDTLDH